MVLGEQWFDIVSESEYNLNLSYCELDLQALHYHFKLLGVKIDESKMFFRESDIYRNLCLATGVGSIMGFCVGGRLGARVAGKDHILANQLTTYKYKMQAHVCFFMFALFSKCICYEGAEVETLVCYISIFAKSSAIFGYSVL